MKGLIITGGSINDEFVKKITSKSFYDQVIAVDGGLAVLDRLGLIPDAVVGDFDTVSPELLEKYQRLGGTIRWEVHKPEKDETDTELAVNTAIALGCDNLLLLGATGGRLDHFLGNLHLLYLCLKKGVYGAIADEQNRLTILDKGRTFQKGECFGTYISFLPLSLEVKGVTLTGFAYPLVKRDIELGSSLCISNQVMGECAAVDFEAGVLICVESRDLNSIKGGTDYDENGPAA